MAYCDKDHGGSLPRGKIEKLNNSQRDFWRHKCAGCAYEMGWQDAQTAEANLRTRVRELEERVRDLQAKLPAGA